MQFVLLPSLNGLRYRIEAGLITWIRDRNGNKLSFGYDGNGRVTSITDSLNRVVMIAYQSDEGPTFGICDRITFNGFNVAPRIIRIARYGLLENSFRPNAGYSKRSLAYLFPGLNGSQQTDYNPNVVSAVYLPDGRGYRFYYNEYGELERVLLPTGGAIEYRMNAGSGVYPTDPDAGDYQIYRRVTERQVYPDGTTMEGKTVYTASSSLPGDTHPWSTTVTIDQVNPSGTVLAHSEHHFNGSGFASLFNTVGYYLYPAWDEGKEWRTFAFDSTGATALRRVTNTFLQRASVSWWSAYASQNNLDTAFEPILDTRLTEAVTKLLDVTPNLASDQKYYYDQYNNQTAVEEFDYGLSSPPTFPTRRTETDYVTTGESNSIDYTATNVHLRSLPREQRVYSVNPTSGALTQAASTHFYYDQYSLTDRTGIVGWEAPATAARGNLTSVTKWLDTGGSITTSQQYDIAGHVVQTTDALGNTSLIEFANSSNTFAFATTMKTPVPDSTGSRGSNARLVTLYDYDFSSGLLKSITDPNNQITTASYNDGLDRLTAVVSPTGGGQVSYFYEDTVGNLFVRTQRTQDASTTLESYQYFDGLGRGFHTSQSEASGSIFVDKQYDALGRVLQVSNPYRSGDTLRWTVTQYDGLGRVQTVTEPGGAQVGSAYSGNSVTVTDPASITRTSVSDALGRVTSVIEDPGSAPHLKYQTSYTYDVLNDLRKVVQGGQTRYFGYDSLKRPIRVKNPEQDINTDLPAFTDPVTTNTQWSMAFSYDNNSNLTAKTDPRKINFTYTYDAMNRVLTRSYPSDPAQTPPVDPAQTPPVEYKYDGVGTTAQNALGKLTAVNTSGSFVSSYTYDNFDAMGRVLHNTQAADSQSYGMSYQYDLAGHLISETYPSNRVVTTSYDATGRINDLSSGTTHYASQFSYAAHGGVTDLKLGNNLWEHTTFEPNRLQPTEIDLGTSQAASDKLKLNYDYGPLTANNGNVMGQTITIPSGPTLTQSFTYDSLNRLKSAQESNGSSWKQKFLYDQFGNRTIDAANTIPSGLVGPNPQVSASTNRITSAGYSYDPAGNLIGDAAGHSYSYDAENMQVTYDTSVAKYAYDGEGRRVRSITNSGALTTVFVYDAMGKLLAEYTNTNPTGAGTSYLTTDALGSPRIVSGTDPANPVKARHDYLPFGEEITVSLGGRTAAQGYIADSVRQKFTGKLRDVETGLDYFGARYYSSATGRFTSPDSLGGDSINPQTLNLYIYVLNNPLASVDPTGHFANPDGALDKLNGWADDKEEGFNRWIEEVDARQEGKNPDQNQASIIDAAANGGDLVLYEAGINNPTNMHTLEARNALIDWLNVPINQIGAVPNGSGFWGGLWAKPDKNSATAMAKLLDYAITDQGIDPSRITIVAHSNGVPTLNLALSLSKAGAVAQFKEIVLVAPATKNVATVTNIANHSKALTIVTSSRDSALGWTWNKRSASSWQKQLKEVHNVSIYETYNKSHSMPYYFEALLNGRYRRLR